MRPSILEDSSKLQEKVMYFTFLAFDSKAMLHIAMLAAKQASQHDLVELAYSCLKSCRF